jgi:hypothetical protein
MGLLISERNSIMSAWWTSKRHIDLIVTAAISLGQISENEATSTGKMLREANALSLRTLYERTLYEKADEYWREMSEAIDT